MTPARAYNRFCYIFGDRQQFVVSGTRLWTDTDTDIDEFFIENGYATLVNRQLYLTDEGAEFLRFMRI